MARKLRIEYAGAFYHLINRGNYRSWIFETKGAKHSFLECLKEVCEAKGWRVHAWCLMSNHYHLLIETPEANLVEGMRWLQSTFSNRFNRFRKENGHVFQGRYKSLVLDHDAVIAVSHYIHLNPVRANLIDVDALEKFEDSSFHQLWYPRKRWGFGVYDTCLKLKTTVPDNRRGRSMYRDYLGWLSSNNEEQKGMGFEQMTRGWAKGNAKFKSALMKDNNFEKIVKMSESEVKQAKELLWENVLGRCLRVFSMSEQTLRTTAKGSSEKIAIAIYLREKHLVPNAWIAEHLFMGAVSSVQSWVSRHRRNGDSESLKMCEKLKNHETLD